MDNMLWLWIKAPPHSQKRGVYLQHVSIALVHVCSGTAHVSSADRPSSETGNEIQRHST